MSFQENLILIGVLSNVDSLKFKTEQILKWECTNTYGFPLVSIWEGRLMKESTNSKLMNFVVCGSFYQN